MFTLKTYRVLINLGIVIMPRGFNFGTASFYVYEFTCAESQVTQNPDPLCTKIIGICYLYA